MDYTFIPYVITHLLMELTTSQDQSALTSRTFLLTVPDLMFWLLRLKKFSCFLISVTAEVAVWILKSFDTAESRVFLDCPQRLGSVFMLGQTGASAAF